MTIKYVYSTKKYLDVKNYKQLDTCKSLQLVTKPINKIENQVKDVKNQECYYINLVNWFHVRHENPIHLFLWSPIK